MKWLRLLNPFWWFIAALVGTMFLLFSWDPATRKEYSDTLKHMCGLDEEAT